MNKSILSSPTCPQGPMELTQGETAIHHPAPEREGEIAARERLEPEGHHLSPTDSGTGRDGRAQRRDGGERPAYLLKALRAIEQILSGRQPIDVPGALMVARHALEVCPACGCDDINGCKTEVTGIDTSYKSCSACFHVWDIG